MTKLLLLPLLFLLSLASFAQTTQLPNPAQSSVTVSVTTSSITWAWAPVQGATYYTIWKACVSSCNYGMEWFAVATTDQPTYTLSNLPPFDPESRIVTTEGNSGLRGTGTTLSGRTATAAPLTFGPFTSSKCGSLTTCTAWDAQYDSVTANGLNYLYFSPLGYCKPVVSYSATINPDNSFSVHSSCVTGQYTITADLVGLKYYSSGWKYRYTGGTVVVTP